LLCRKQEVVMPGTINFVTVSTDGLESSPVVDTLAGLRANEARYFMNKYTHEFVTVPAADAPEIVERITLILRERDIEIASTPLEVTDFVVEGTRMSYVFFESGLVVNVMYTLETAAKRAVGFKLSQSMEVPDELAAKFKFARQKSKLAGEIRGSYFVVKGEY
jgi:hypothetical protein